MIQVTLSHEYNVDRLQARKLQDEGLSARRQSASSNQVTWVIHKGGFLLIIYHNCQKSSPIRWTMSWNTHGILDIFITWRFCLAVCWISRQYIHHYVAKIKADFVTKVILLMPWLIRYFGQNMVESSMGGNFNFIEQLLTLCSDSLNLGIW
jgi:hypothetical protein